MKHNIILLILLLSVGTSTAAQNQQCIDLFATNSEILTKADTSGNHAIEEQEAVNFENTQIGMDKLLNPDNAKIVSDFSVLGCGIPKNYISANQIQTQTPTQKVGMWFVFIAIIALIYLESKRTKK
ncbi:MAG: hypothetical protein OIN86_04685 [Candidatus Methanoperedens sp.]|nr:hypothetical protein [Candidatus Methanoperedens sp.]CAG0996799.1 hypothetical protein METP1_02620 [Methanosarcinales archaeon]